ncbi:MAG: FAD-binding protein, partial [Specibacter sp.]
AALGTITIMENTFVQDLVVREGRIAGVDVLSGGRQQRLAADAVLLASGGAGQLYDHTTNPGVATADGLAAAWRAGAVVADLEYFQFHPTALAVSGNFLISEAVRGAGAVLRDASGEAFMARYHPEGDLAPRDVVSRSIAAHLDSTRDGVGVAAGTEATATVFLDATGVEAAHGTGYLARRFPTIAAKTRELGFDWTSQWLPVIPAAHYWMGGVVTTLDAQTSLPGLYAAGEVACTGVHGANRLASNSLLEGLVFGRRAVQSFVDATAAPDGGAHNIAPTAAELAATPLDLAPPGRAMSPEPFTRETLQRLMGAHAGVVRNRRDLQVAAQILASWRPEQSATLKAGRDSRPPATDEAVMGRPGTEQVTVEQAGAELENLRLVAELLVHAALSRQESVGAHYRSDHPQTLASDGQSLAESAAGRRTASWVAAPTITHFPTSLPVLESETV